MVGFTRRAFLRRYLEAPIEFSGHGLEDGQRALVFDCCKGGMHFISACYIEVGSAITVSPCEALSQYFNGRCDSGCRARVVWCRRCTERNQQGFNIGVKFISHDDSGHHPGA